MASQKRNEKRVRQFVIEVTVFRNSLNQIYGFQVENHGKISVCAAVSTLVINTFNAIETFADCHLNCDFSEEGGFFSYSVLELKNNQSSHDAELLNKTLFLGLNCLMAEHKKDLKIIDNFLGGEKND